MDTDEKFQSEGFAIVRDVLSAETISELLAQLDGVTQSNAIRRRGRSYFGIRNLLNVVPAVRELADVRGSGQSSNPSLERMPR